MAVLDPVFSAELQKEVAELLRKGEASGEKVGTWEAIAEKLLAAGAAWRIQVPPEQVGIHPVNRSGGGVGGAEAHMLGAKILAAGWSWQKASGAVAVEMPPPPADARAKAVNEELVAVSGGLLPPLGMARLLSIGGSHTNSFLRAVKGNCRAATDKLADKDGRLNREQLSINRPGFAEALERGLHWLVLHHQVADVWPSLLSFGQAALNTDAREVQSETEVLLAISALRDAAAAQGKEPEWTRWAAAAVASQPPCAAYSDTLAQYVAAQAPDLVRELSLFVKAFASHGSRTLGSDFWAKVVGLNFGKAEKYPLVQNALVKGNLLSPPHKMRDGICGLLPAGALSQVTTKANRPAVKAAEALMRDARELAATMGATPADSIKVVGMLDVRLACHLCKRGKDLEKEEFKDIAAIRKAFIDQLSAAVGTSVIPEEWETENPDGAAAAPKPPAAVATSAPETIDQIESKEFQAAKLGFVEGAIVAPKKTDELQLFRFQTFDNGYAVVVRLNEGHDGETKRVEVDAFLEAWRLHKGKTTTLLPFWSAEAQEGSPLKSVSWATEGARGAVNLALAAAYAAHESVVGGVELLVHPTGVKAARAFEPEELVLVAASARVEKAKLQTEVAANSYPVGRFDLAGNTALFQLSPHFVPPADPAKEPRSGSEKAFVAPFWLVDTVGKKDAKKANLQLRYDPKMVGPHEVQVPTFVNTKPLAPGDRLVADVSSKTEHLQGAKRRRIGSKQQQE